MNASFKIQAPQNQAIDSSQCNLLLEISPDYILSGILHPLEKKFISLEYFRLDSHDSLNSFKRVVFNHEWFSKPFNAVKITYNFPESLIIPAGHHVQDTVKDSLNIVFGDANQGQVFSEYLSYWNSFNAYRVPESYVSVLNAHFVQPQYAHMHAVILKKLAIDIEQINGDNLFVFFYERKLIVACLKDRKLMLIQTYSYETAEDINYLLLNICTRFELDCEKINIQVSGLLDDQSSVYSEMRKYFTNVILNDRPDTLAYSENFEEYPPHFFNSVYWSALCGL